MMFVSPSMKEKYPYWYAMVEKEQQQRQIDEMLMMAEIQFSQFVDDKMKDVDNMVNEIKNRLQETRFDVEATINNKTMSNEVINREIKKMVMEQFKKAVK